MAAIQDSFSIQFGEEGPFPKTVGELCDRVIEKLKGARTSKCLTSITFYRVRRALVAGLELDRNGVAPSAMLAPLLARGPGRRRQWKDLERRTGLRFPALTHPSSMTAGMLIIAIGFATRFAFEGWEVRSSFVSLPVLLASWLLSLILSIVADGMTQRLVWGIPRNCKTVGDLVRVIMAKNYGTLADEAGGWNEKEVWKALRLFIADEISIAPDKITPATSFPDGLNIF